LLTTFYSCYFIYRLDVWFRPHFIISLTYTHTYTHAHTHTHLALLGELFSFRICYLHMRWYFLSLFCKVAFCQPFLSLNQYEWVNASQLIGWSDWSSRPVTIPIPLLTFTYIFMVHSSVLKRWFLVGELFLFCG